MRPPASSNKGSSLVDEHPVRPFLYSSRTPYPTPVLAPETKTFPLLSTATSSFASPVLQLADGLLLPCGYSVTTLAAKLPKSATKTLPCASVVTPIGSVSPLE